ncbi:hypothetical protein [Burkholderia gladioli]|uniref:hypothetical protein n=1 Tax=Burkholderia gladioli TaxID=28095 RepID=UPI00163E95FB|nr:hypothetical protein [Burkholderia gladioli]
MKGLYSIEVLQGGTVGLLVAMDRAWGGSENGLVSTHRTVAEQIPRRQQFAAPALFDNGR